MSTPLQRKPIPAYAVRSPSPLRLLALGAASFPDLMRSGVGVPGSSPTGADRVDARTVWFSPADLPDSLAHGTFDLAVVDCAVRDAGLAAALERLRTIALPWIGLVPDATGDARAWLLDRGAADYAEMRDEIGRDRLAAAIGNFAANRQSDALVIAAAKETRHRLAAVLKGLGFGTVIRRNVDNGFDAGAVQRGTRLVLLGPDLGIARALEWIDNLRGPCRSGDLAVIALTPAGVLSGAGVGAGAAATFILHGVSDAITPPYSPELLSLRINTAMRLRRLEARSRIPSRNPILCPAAGLS